MEQKEVKEIRKMLNVGNQFTAKIYKQAEKEYVVTFILCANGNEFILKLQEAKKRKNQGVRKFKTIDFAVKVIEELGFKKVEIEMSPVDYERKESFFDCL